MEDTIELNISKFKLNNIFNNVNMETTIKINQILPPDKRYFRRFAPKYANDLMISAIDIECRKLFDRIEQSYQINDKLSIMCNLFSFISRNPYSIAIDNYITLRMVIYDKIIEIKEQILNDDRVIRNSESTIRSRLLRIINKLILHIQRLDEFDGISYLFDENIHQN